MNHPTCLLLTHRRDYFTIDRVAAALAERGARPVRVDTDRFPGELVLSAVDRGEGLHYLLDDGERVIRGEEVTAVWTRSPWPPAAVEKLEPEYRQACAQQSRAALDGFLDGLTVARWVNEPQRNLQGGNKVRQLRLAARSGLAIPRTLVTNDAEQVRHFFRELGGQMVAKLLLPLSQSMDRSGPFMPTSEVGEEDLAALETLRYAPMIFQERVAKALELRAMYVGGRLYTGAIDARASAAGKIDWRMAEGDACWQPGSLPAEVSARLARLMDELGLVYGAIDLILTPAGEYVFLEVNPLGEWGMLEQELGLPISHAVAEALLGSAI